MSALQKSIAIVADTSRPAEGIRPETGAKSASQTQALAYAPGSMQQIACVPYADNQDCGGAARGSRELIRYFDPR